MVNASDEGYKGHNRILRSYVLFSPSTLTTPFIRDIFRTLDLLHCYQLTSLPLSNLITMSQTSQEARSSGGQYPQPESDTGSLHIEQPSYGPSEEPDASLIIDLQSADNPSEAFSRLSNHIQSIVPGAVINFGGKSARVVWPTGVIHKSYSELPNPLDDAACALWLVGSQAGREWAGRTNLMLVKPSSTAVSLQVMEKCTKTWLRMGAGDSRVSSHSPRVAVGRFLCLIIPSKGVGQTSGSQIGWRQLGKSRLGFEPMILAGSKVIAMSKERPGDRGFRGG